MMQAKEMDPRRALDVIVDRIIHSFDLVNKRCNAFHYTGRFMLEEVINVYDPDTDRYLTVWFNKREVESESYTLASMKEHKVSAFDALDDIVTRIIQEFEDVNPRCRAYRFIENRCADRIYRLVDPELDHSVTIWLSLNWQGRRLVEHAQEILRGVTPYR